MNNNIVPNNNNKNKNRGGLKAKRRFEIQNSLNSEKFVENLQSTTLVKDLKTQDKFSKFFDNLLNKTEKLIQKPTNN